jgi:hypothetical protein
VDDGERRQHAFGVVDGKEEKGKGKRKEGRGNQRGALATRNP